MRCSKSRDQCDLFQQLQEPSGCAEGLHFRSCTRLRLLSWDPGACCFWGAGTHRGCSLPPVVLCPSAESILTDHTLSLNVGYPSGAIWGAWGKVSAPRLGGTGP